VVALAHGGNKGRGVHGQDLQGQDNQDNGRGFGRLKRPERICREVGVSLSGRPTSGLASGRNPFSETQIKELQAACKTLAGAFETEHNAVTAAVTKKQKAIETALAALPENCRPRRHHRHDRRDRFGPTGPTGATGASGATSSTGSTGSTGSSGATGPSSTACKEARKEFRKKVQAAEEEFRGEITKASTALDTALMEFDKTVRPILQSVGHHHQPMGPTGTSGPSGMSGPSGATGSKGTTGSMGTTGSTGSHGFTPPSREPDSGSWRQGGSGSWGGQQQVGDYGGRPGGDGR
jgi:hypothetical protein